MEGIFALLFLVPCERLSEVNFDHVVPPVCKLKCGVNSEWKCVVKWQVFIIRIIVNGVVLRCDLAAVTVKHPRTLGEVNQVRRDWETWLNGTWKVGGQLSYLLLSCPLVWGSQNYYTQYFRSLVILLCISYSTSIFKFICFLYVLWP